MWGSVEEETSSTTINKQVKKYGGVQVGDFIQMEGNRRGVVRFIGTVHFGKTKQEIWYGCELEHATGKHNGTYNDETYFVCRANFGIFIKKKKIIKVLIRSNDHRSKRMLERTRKKQKFENNNAKKFNRGVGGGRKNMKEVNTSKRKMDRSVTPVRSARALRNRKVPRKRSPSKKPRVNIGGSKDPARKKNDGAMAKRLLQLRSNIQSAGKKHKRTPATVGIIKRKPGLGSLSIPSIDDDESDNLDSEYSEDYSETDGYSETEDTFASSGRGILSSPAPSIRSVDSLDNLPDIPSYNLNNPWPDGEMIQLLESDEENLHRETEEIDDVPSDLSRINSFVRQGSRPGKTTPAADDLQFWPGLASPNLSNIKKEGAPGELPSSNRVSKMQRRTKSVPPLLNILISHVNETINNKNEPESKCDSFQSFDVDFIDPFTEDDNDLPDLPDHLIPFTKKYSAPGKLTPRPTELEAGDWDQIDIDYIGHTPMDKLDNLPNPDFLIKMERTKSAPGVVTPRPNEKKGADWNQIDIDYICHSPKDKFHELPDKNSFLQIKPLRSPAGQMTPRPPERHEADWDNFNLDHLPDGNRDNFNETLVKISKNDSKLKRKRSKPGLTTPKVLGIDLVSAEIWASTNSLQEESGDELPKFENDIFFGFDDDLPPIPRKNRGYADSNNFVHQKDKKETEVGEGPDFEEGLAEFQNTDIIGDKDVNKKQINKNKHKKPNIKIDKIKLFASPVIEDEFSDDDSDSNVSETLLPDIINEIGGGDLNHFQSQSYTKGYNHSDNKPSQPLISRRATGGNGIIMKSLKNLLNENNEKNMEEDEEKEEENEKGHAQPGGYIIDGGEDPVNWSIEEVVEWCENTNDISVYSNIMRKHKVDGNQLLNLNAKKLKKQFGLKNDVKIDVFLEHVENLRFYSAELAATKSDTFETGSLRQLRLSRKENQLLLGTVSEACVKDVVDTGTKFHNYLVNTNDDILTDERFIVGNATYDHFIKKINQEIQPYLNENNCIIKVNLSEVNLNKNTRAVTLKGTLAEIARARQLLMGKGLDPQLSQDEWFDVLKNALVDGDILHIRQFLGQGIMRELNDEDMIKSVTLCQENLNNISIAVTIFLIGCLPSYNLCDKNGLTLLSYYCGAENKTPSLDLVKFLIECGADVKRLDKVQQLTPLFHAIAGGNTDVVNRLLEHPHITTNVQNSMGDTCLMFACGMRTDRYEPGEPNFEAIKNLIETHDVDVNVQNSDGVTPLMVGVGFIGFDYRTLEPLYCDPEPDTVAYLLEHGANVDNQDAKNRTALHYAVESGEEDIVELLIDSKANVNILDTDGKKAIDFSRQEEITELLLHADDPKYKPKIKKMAKKWTR